MADDKGKKLADLMYGQRMDEGGAAFGVFPQMKPRRSKQDPEAAKDVPRQLLRGWAAGTLGLPGDIEGLIRMLPGLDETPRLPTSEFYLDYLPGKAQGPAGEAAAGFGTLFGGVGSTKVARGALEAGKAAGKAGRAALETVGTGPSSGGLAAQRGAVKVPGTPKPKTPYERSLEQGYEHGWYHGTTGDIKSFDPKLRGETTGARSAQKGFFFVRDPQNPPESMRVKSSDPQSIEMMRKLGYSDEEIAKMNQMSFEGNAAETASQYAKIGGSRAYKEAMRKANAAERRGDWDEYERQMHIAEDHAFDLQYALQDVTAKYGEARDVMLDKLEKAIYDRPLPQDQAEALDEWRKANMPYGWYNQFSAEQFGNLEKKLVDKFGEEKVEPLLNAIKDFRSVANERALLENTQEGSNVMPVALRYKKPYVHDYQGSPYRDESYADLIDKALTEGYDSLLLKNTFDPGGGPGKLVDVGVVFDPAQIRSRFAKFNPEDIQSPDITKAKGGAVRFTNNPDAMLLELEKPAIKPISKAAGGAITADDLIIEERPL